MNAKEAKNFKKFNYIKLFRQSTRFSGILYEGIDKAILKEMNEDKVKSLKMLDIGIKM